MDIVTSVKCYIIRHKIFQLLKIQKIYAIKNDVSINNKKVYINIYLLKESLPHVNLLKNSITNFIISLNIYCRSLSLSLQKVNWNKKNIYSKKERSKRKESFSEHICSSIKTP